MQPPPAPPPKWFWYLACGGTIALLWIILFGWFPYTAGYEATERSLFRFVRSGWGSGDGQWEHCIFVPFITMGLIWWSRKKFHTLPVAPATGGILLFALAMLLYWIGFLIDQRYLGYAAMQGLTGALIVWFLGWQHFRVLFFPWLFLVFMWPVIFLDNALAFPLREIMSHLSHHFLNLIGIENVQRGTAILSAPVPTEGIAEGSRFSLDVANPCSGIRSLFALMMVSALYGYLILPTSHFFSQWRQKSPWRDFLASGLDAWRQWLLFASALPLAVAGNILRIILLTFGTLAFGTEFAIGESIDNPSGFHIFAGFAVFALALVGMVFLGKIMVWIPEKIALLRKGEWKTPTSKEEEIITY